MVSSAGPTLGNGTSSSSNQNPETERYLMYLNHSLSTNYLYALVAIGGIVFAYHNVLRLQKHVRHLISLGGNSASQRYFSAISPSVAWLKNHLIYAPLLHHTRAREIKWGSRLVVGTVPTRIQTLFILAVLAFNIFACVWDIPWSSPQLEVLPILRNRTGTLATVNLIPICLLATIKNPLIKALDISYDSFNLVHRWVGRLSILQGITHTLCWMIAKVQKAGWSAVTHSFANSSFIYTGLIATVGFTVLGLHSPKIFRSLAYEFFLHFHIVLVAMTFGGLWMHLKDLPQQMFLLAAVIIWVGSRIWRLSTMIYRSCGRGGSKALIENLPGGAVKIQLFCARPWKVRPGQTLYLSIPSIGLWTMHPFSVAWSDTNYFITRSDSIKSMRPTLSGEKDLVVAAREIGVAKGSTGAIQLIVKSKGGFTSKLFAQSAAQEGRHFILPAYVEGPYGHETSLASFGTVLLFASGVGVTHQMLYVRSLVQGYAEGTVATQKITLVWVVPDLECLEWVRDWMQEILSMEKRRDVLKILLYVTRVKFRQNTRSPSASIRIIMGRPVITDVIEREAREQVGCLGVSVCANGSLADDVRMATRMVIKEGIDASFKEEGFGW